MTRLFGSSDDVMWLTPCLSSYSWCSVHVTDCVTMGTDRSLSSIITSTLGSLWDHVISCDPHLFSIFTFAVYLKSFLSLLYSKQIFIIQHTKHMNVREAPNFIGYFICGMHGNHEHFLSTTLQVVYYICSPSHGIIIVDHSWGRSLLWVVYTRCIS